jgi:hypothetical protein
VRLLAVGEALGATGYGRVMESVLAPLSRSGVEVVLFAVDFRGDPGAAELPFAVRPNVVPGDNYGVDQLPRVLDEVEPDVVLFHRNAPFFSMHRDAWASFRERRPGARAVVYSPDRVTATGPGDVRTPSKDLHAVTNGDPPGAQRAHSASEQDPQDAVMSRREAVTALTAALIGGAAGIAGGWVGANTQADAQEDLDQRKGDEAERVARLDRFRGVDSECGRTPSSRSDHGPFAPQFMPLRTDAFEEHKTALAAGLEDADFIAVAVFYGHARDANANPQAFGVGREAAGRVDAVRSEAVGARELVIKTAVAKAKARD